MLCDGGEVAGVGPVFLVGRSAMAAAVEGAGSAGYAFRRSLDMILKLGLTGNCDRIGLLRPVCPVKSDCNDRYPGQGLQN